MSECVCVWWWAENVRRVHENMYDHGRKRRQTIRITRPLLLLLLPHSPARGRDGRVEGAKKELSTWTPPPGKKVYLA